MRNQEVAVPQKVILTKNGNAIWVSADKGTEFEEILKSQNGHRFIRIKELDRSINTAEVAEVMTESQYDDYLRIKRGSYQCKWKTWHEKKNECDCQRIAYQKEQEQLRKEQELEESKELTPEERKRRQELLAKTRRELEEKGILQKRSTTAS